MPSWIAGYVAQAEGPDEYCLPRRGCIGTSFDEPWLARRPRLLYQFRTRRLDLEKVFQQHFWNRHNPVIVLVFLIGVGIRAWGKAWGMGRRAQDVGKRSDS